jgi:uncharacterized protein with ACT and thioredoxin-like domain
MTKITKKKITNATYDAIFVSNKTNHGEIVIEIGNIGGIHERFLQVVGTFDVVRDFGIKG